MPTSIAAALTAGQQQLRGISDVAALEARSLLASVLDCDSSHLIAHDDVLLSASQHAAYSQALQRRASGQPLAYIVGWREFYGLQLQVNPAVLIPRPETELLVDLALSLLPATAVARVLDLGTGSGAIALALLNQRAQLHAVATDLSADALRLAAANARQHGLDARVKWYQGSWYQALPATQQPARQPFELIVSNPPYVAADDVHLLQGDCRHEPQLALTPGADDLASYRAIIAGAAEHLQAGGWLLLEHGHDQRDRLLQLFAATHWQQLRTHDDLAGIARVIVAQYQPDQ
ncbi:MAG: peptide chain release factor N(5)-glutamine methyltransferase [Gammaproteobacteria bacterium]|nr:peptide chain release factor N(5)-glutamine methyltransferase [Gammaproteobacteria bacterium]